jgi:hypothetical protein
VNFLYYKSFVFFSNVKAEINRLVKVEKEKAILLAHFTKYKDQKDDASLDLNNLVTDEAKLEFLRAFLPGMLSEII